MSRNGKAPGGAFPAAGQKAAINLLMPGQGSSDPVVDASPIRIERMVAAIFQKEERIKQWETLSRILEGKRYMRPPGEARPRFVYVDDELKQSRSAQDKHLDEVRHLIDYALTTGAYEDVKCPDCKSWTMPLPPLNFIKSVPTAEPPPGSTSMCKTCTGRGLVRKRRTDPEAKAAIKRITYFKKALDETVLCARIRYGTAGANEAYLELERRNIRLLNKFSNETQTSLEGEDAGQGVRKGIVDAAMRFDPTRPTCAMFSTVAYKWCFRNSRHRQPGQKRAGVYAPSIDASSPEEGNLSSLISGRCGPFGVRSLKLGRGQADKCRKCGDLSELDPDTFEPTGFCKACDAVATEKEKEKETPQPLRSSPVTQRVSDDQTLIIDLRSQVAKLPKRQREVITAIMGGGFSQSKNGATLINMSAVARDLGMKKATALRLRDAAFETLRGTMGSYVDVVCD